MTHTPTCRKARETWLHVSTLAAPEASVKAENARRGLEVFGDCHTHPLSAFARGLRETAWSPWNGNELALKAAGKVPHKLHIYLSPQASPSGLPPCSGFTKHWKRLNAGENLRPWNTLPVFLQLNETKSLISSVWKPKSATPSPLSQAGLGEPRAHSP